MGPIAIVLWLATGETARGKGNKGEWWRRGELGRDRVGKTRKLLYLQRRKNAKYAVYAPPIHV
jgi:hypothetical protein